MVTRNGRMRVISDDRKSERFGAKPGTGSFRIELGVLHRQNGTMGVTQALSAKLDARF